MALIRCAECKKEVSSSAVSCPHCGFVIGGSGSVGNIAFENRIEEYKEAKYNLIKRNGDYVQLSKANKQTWILLSISVACIILYFVCIIVFTPSVSSYSRGLSEMIFKENLTKNMIRYGIVFFPLCIVSMIRSIISTKVFITITKTGKLEEKGNILKNS